MVSRGGGLAGGGGGAQSADDENDTYAADSIRPKCVELQRLCQQYKDLLRQRREQLTKSRDLHDRLDKVLAVL